MRPSALRGLAFLVTCTGLLFLVTPPAFAQFTVTLTFDENCNGSYRDSLGLSLALPCSQIPDPGPGGLNNALFYSMLNPPGLVAGDVLIMEPPSDTLLSDILRFDPVTQGGGVFVYSDIDADSPPVLADIGFPTSYNTNTLTIDEGGVEGVWNGVIYRPTPGQPGFVAGSAGPVTYNFGPVPYNFTSDAAPEPATGLLLLAPLAALVLRRRK
jgi:hypothetical protein